MPAIVGKGQALKGTPDVSYSNRLDKAAASMADMPTKKGEYTAWFVVPETAEHMGLSYALDFTISATSAIGNGEGYYSIYDYASRAVLTVNGYDGEALQNFPMYVRVKQGMPAGFSYDGLKRGADDIRFFDSTGRSLTYEVDWDESGESAFWVRVPTVRKGTEITMCWNLRDGCSLPERGEAKEVWAEYTGVWHMDEKITAATAATNLSHDVTGNGLDMVPSCGAEGNRSVMKSIDDGVFGRARVNDVKEEKKGSTAGYRVAGNFLAVSNRADLLKFGGVFTLSYWVRVDDYLPPKTTAPKVYSYPKVMARRNGTTTTGYMVEIPQTDRKSLTVYGDGNDGGSVKILGTDIASLGRFVHLAFVYDGPSVSVYSDGVCMKDGMAIATVPDNTDEPMAFGNLSDGGDLSLWGKFDEVRLFRGKKSADWVAAEHAQSKKDVKGQPMFYTAGAVTNDASAVIRNDWIVQPSITKTTWEADEAPPTLADFNLGKPCGGSSQGAQTITFYDRATGEELGGDVPTAVGDYRAVISVAKVGGWGALEHTIDFRIVSHQASHALGLNYDRILLANDDYSVAGGEVTDQNYDAEEDDLGLPYWRHLDEDGHDDSTTGEAYWSDSLLFNLGGGSHHVYYDGNTNRLWDLRDVRIGNTFNNGELLAEETGMPEEYDEGLATNQNYLCWNPESQRVIGGWTETVGPWHEFAGQIVMQNTLDSAITSPCYSNGIGTVYFDAVNGWTDNVTNELGEANYRLVVEIATNKLNSTLAPYDENGVDSIVSNDVYNAEGQWIDKVGVVKKAAAYADWKQVPVRVLRFDGDYCDDLGMQDALTLNIVEGGTYECFYRVIVPVNTHRPARFRIRRVAIDKAQEFNPDGLAYVLVDNVICSAPTVYANLEPYGHFDAKKTGKRALGFEGAFVPAFPSSQDTAVRGRAKVRMSDGSPYSGTGISSATMHYRWHYLEQKTTDWMLADLDPKTLVAKRTLDLPQYQGDIDFWFELNQNSAYYSYADYSGLTDGSGKPLGLGGSGYTEERSSVTNRASGADWYVRTREGRSPYAEARVLVKVGKEKPVPVVMTVSDNQVWRGFYRMQSAPKDGILWRVELCDRQGDGETTWNANTNCLYVKDWVAEMPTFPAAGRMSEGTTNEWSRMPCDMQTDYLMFQVDEQTYGVTVIHACYQDFNSWNDAGNGYFTGSSAETNKMSGSSINVRTYAESYAGWEDEQASDDIWSAVFEGPLGAGNFKPSYKTFDSKKEDLWELIRGQWVHEYYRDANGRVGFQMEDGGDLGGRMEFKDKSGILKEGGWPRGLESISFNARIAQRVSLDNIAFLDGGVKLKDYTFMTRVCFDRNRNRNFIGNASLSLFAYYRADKGAYEARWEQIEGDPEENPSFKGIMTGPKKRGQRLVVSRWNKTPTGYEETPLVTVTNSVSINADMPLMPYGGSSATNNLMPFCISVYKRANGDTVILAGVRMSADTEDKAPSGVSWDTPLSSMKDKWCFACAIDGPATALKSGSYGVLSANCEGLFLTPQFRDGISYPDGVPPESLVTQCYGGWDGKTSTSARKALNSVDGYSYCYEDIADGWWGVDDGREQEFGGMSATASPYGFAYVALPQTVDVYTKPMGATGPIGDTWTYRDSVLLQGFGKPGTSSGYTATYWHPSDVAVKLQTGGEYDGSHVDVVIADVSMRQWRGCDNWSTSKTDWDFKTDVGKTDNDFGRTNVVFTSGWVTNGAVRLSAKRALDGSACSVRSPLLDGYGGRGNGLGKLSIRYRKPSENVRLLVQVVTNYTYNTGDTLVKMSRTVEEGDGNKTWHTIAKIGYNELWKNNTKTVGSTKVWDMSLGYHGVKGMMRIVVDNDLVKDIANETDPKHFGEIDIVEAMFKDEPTLEKDCWWGWNLQAVGDPGDTQRRMYLPDCAGTLAASGQSLALNNSVTDGTNPAEETEDFKKHMPFLQSPTFTNGIIGQVSFKARKYDLSDRSAPAKVVVYGADEKTPSQDLMRDDNWTFIAEFPVTNTIYTTYTCKTDGQKFRTVRFAVVDVAGTEYPPAQPPKGAAAQRVLLDEVMVSEAVRAMLAFRNVGAFRSKLNDDEHVPNVPSADEQPLCDENWGVQAEVFASMLADEIDPSASPKVTLHWYVGKEPWGFENWKAIPVGTKDEKGAKEIRGSAELASTAGSNYVYRSSFKTAPAAVMQAQSEPDTVVQYMLEVEYQVINSATGKSTPATNWLDAASWSTPDWYAPIDFNADPEYGANKTFAGYTILDRIAPGWAWINEANIYGKKTSSGGNADEQFQYVEVCVPLEADLSGWQLRFLDYINDHQVVTNKIAKFGSEPGDNAAGTKNAKLSMAQNKTFRLIGNKESAKLRKDNETLDGIWGFSQLTTTFRYNTNDKMYYVYDVEQPFGVQLLRPSGIIESSVVIVGTNSLGRLPGWESYDPTNIVAGLNRLVKGSKFFYAAEDCWGEGRSGSVTDGRGESPSVWTNNWACSPGYINTNYAGAVQKINPNHPTPHGDSIIVYAYVDTKLGHITQYVGGPGSTATNAVEMIVLNRGGSGTNIFYKVDPWFELKSVTTNDIPAWAYLPDVTTNTLAVGVGASNNVTVVASAQLNSRLRKYIDEDDPYMPAVVDWLLEGVDAHGNKFKNPGTIALADYLNMEGEIVTNLTLKQMYWLDMDPTASNLVFQGGFAKTKSQNPWTEPKGGKENLKMTIFMMISNRNDGTAWSPYILRGLDPNYTSWQYTGSAQSWTSETFKVTGILANGKTSRFNVDNWVPLRYFVFHEDSFYQPSDEPTHGRFTTDIELNDPHYSNPDWNRWFNENDPSHSTPIYNWWFIDERIESVGAEILKEENFYP